MKRFIIVLPIIILFSVCFFASSANAADASIIYFKTTETSFAPGSEFVVGVFVTTDVPINAVRAEIGFSAGLLEWLGSNTAHSIIRIWKDSPRRSEEGILILEGGTSAPFKGRAGELIELYFRVRDDTTQSVQISLRDASLFLADGKGSEVRLGRSFLTIPVSAGLSKKTLPVISDVTPPVVSFFKIIKEPVLGRSLVIWEGSDSESGIVSEEVSTRSWFLWKPWMTQKSPTGIDAGAWSIRVALTDRTGNHAESVLYRWDVLTVKAGIAVGILILLVFFVMFLIRRRFRVK